jgi:hypothetical protein
MRKPFTQLYCHLVWATWDLRVARWDIVRVGLSHPLIEHRPPPCLPPVRQVRQ